MKTSLQAWLENVWDIIPGTAFYNLLKRLKLPTNVQRIRVDDFDYTEDVPVIQDENPINDINSVMEKNLENESNFEVRVSIFGEVNVSIHDLPNLVLEAHEKGFELEIKEVIEEVNQPLLRGWFYFYMCYNKFRKKIRKINIYNSEKKIKKEVYKSVKSDIIVLER